jgi:hypothetical protein
MATSTMMKRMDSTGDGSVDINEFKSWFTEMTKELMK